MLKTIFRIVAGALWLMGRVTGRTYNEMNIIVYYFMIPYSWLLMLDAIWGFHYCAIVGGVFYLLLWLAIKNFKSFSDDVFELSVKFLNSFNKFILLFNNSASLRVFYISVYPHYFYQVKFILSVKQCQK
jgi:hypothetical protein